MLLRQLDPLSDILIFQLHWQASERTFLLSVLKMGLLLIQNFCILDLQRLGIFIATVFFGIQNRLSLLVCVKAFHRKIVKLE